MKSTILILFITGFLGAFAAGIAWASNILDPNDKSWFWVLVASLIVAFVFGIAKSSIMTTWNSIYLLFAYAVGLVLGAGAFFVYVRLTDAQKWKDTKTAVSAPYQAPDEELRRWQRLNELSFHAKEWGLRFSYVSENRSGKSVSITHQQDVVRLNLGNDENGGALKLFRKAPEQSLLDFLKKMYPTCGFYSHDFIGEAGEKFDRYHYPKGYSVVIPRGDCPTIGIEIPSTKVGRCFVMDNAYPDKYIYLVLPSYPVESVRPSREEPFPLEWHDSIRFF